MKGVRVKVGNIEQIVFKILLFISSYIPLFVILFLKNINNLSISISIMSLLVVVPLIVIRLYISNQLKYEANRTIILTKIEGKENEILGYISGYIIPFIAFNEEIITETGISVPDLLIVFILFSVICSLYMKANMYYVNPIINIFYNIYSGKDKNGGNIIVIVEKEAILLEEREVIVRRLSPGIFLYVNKETRKCRITIKVICIVVILMLMCLFLWNLDAQQYIYNCKNKLKQLIEYICTRILLEV